MTENTVHCPICSSTNLTKASMHYCVCRQCGITINNNYSPRAYDDDYFLKEYKNQYGKTYIQDYDAITAVSRNRLAFIFKHLKKEPDTLSLLEIGSAAGFFLHCSKELGIKKLTGIEISHYAAAYCIKTYRIPVMQASFDDITLQEQYDIIAAWFFIEHCAQPGAIMKKIYNALSDGGVFAFSGPSTFGPLYVFNREAWIATHPTDHRIDFSPLIIKKILKTIGYKRIYVRPSGMHPERIVSKKNIAYRPFSFLYRLFSNITAFSDTIEVYAVK